MRILGISAFYHDSAAAIIKDGCVLYAIEEERLSRVKHDNQFPFRAVMFCLTQAKVSINDLDYVVYYEKPLLKFERILDDFVKTYPFSSAPFVKALPEWLTHKIKVEHIIRKQLGYQGEIFFCSSSLLTCCCDVLSLPISKVSYFNH